jgi:hypothetical protein
VSKKSDHSLPQTDQFFAGPERGMTGGKILWDWLKLRQMVR